ncbi:uncharacterized protein [Periplaneta americana]|uniref:uncharacterized protein n=1 Tax=Periplaneta americana TaxID=6978 RepID=UPI0037E7AE8E
MLLLSAFSISILLQLHATSSESVLDRSCTEAGVVPHPDDCTQFLICAEDNGTFYLAETVPCPEGYSFAKEDKTCVRSKQCKPLPVRTARATTPTGQCKMSGPYCEDCNHMVVCSRMEGKGLVAVANVTCSDIDGDMSCSKASCNTDPQVCEGSDKQGSFLCLTPGFFPDPSDCKRFHMCDKNLIHYSMDCDEQYNVKTESCTAVDPDQKDKTQAAGTQEKTPTCTPLANPCTATNNAPLSLPGRSNYYVICLPKKPKNGKMYYVITVLKCPDPLTFNDKTQSCEFSCTEKRGRFLDPDNNCNSYIECVAGTTGAGTKKTCPEGYGFDPDRKACLPESMVPNCRKPKPTEETTTPVVTTTTPTTTSTVGSVGPVTPQQQGLQCTSEGAMPDYSDCTKYIMCLKYGAYFTMKRRQCHWFTYFDPKAGYCRFGFC